MKVFNINKLVFQTSSYIFGFIQNLENKQSFLSNVYLRFQSWIYFEKDMY